MTAQTEQQKLFDLNRLLNNRNRAAYNYEAYSFLKDYVSTELVERIKDVKRNFNNSLDWGSHDGRGASELLKTDQIDSIICAEYSPVFANLARIRNISTISAPFESVPFIPNSFDLIVSTLSLHWVNDLSQQFNQFHEALKPDGLFTAALFGLGTLKELRESLIEAEIELYGGASQRVPPLPSLHDMAMLLQQAGFALPVADVDRVTVRYNNLFKLLGDLKGMGEQSPMFKRSGQGLSRKLLRRADEIYRENCGDSDGKIPATFQIIWVSGWSPSPNQPKALRRGSAMHSLAEAVQQHNQQT